jgi:AAA15 family ATPase/GTPase
MYKSFEIKDFRCFQELKIEGLNLVNLIAGVNNIGKTALLEALFIYCGAYNPELTLRINAFRGIELIKFELSRWAETPWDSIFRDFDTTKTIELAGEKEKNGRRILRLKIVRKAEELASINRYIKHEVGTPKTSPLSLDTAQVLLLEYEEKNISGKHHMILDPIGLRIEPISPPPPFPAFFQSDRMQITHQETTERFGNLEKQGKQDVLLRVLQLIEPRLRRLTVIVEGGRPILQGDVGLSRPIPLPFMGGGIVRLANLILHISNAQNGIVLVDEIENGLHYSILPKVWRAIGEVAREFNTQVFATTHSLECIIAAHKAFAESLLYDFRLHRLERPNDTISAITYDKESLEASIETGLEMR